MRDGPKKPRTIAEIEKEIKDGSIKKHGVKLKPITANSDAPQSTHPTIKRITKAIAEKKEADLAFKNPSDTPKIPIPPTTAVPTLSPAALRRAHLQKLSDHRTGKRVGKRDFHHGNKPQPRQGTTTGTQSPRTMFSEGAKPQEDQSPTSPSVGKKKPLK